MILFFGSLSDEIYAVQADKQLTDSDLSKLTWLFGDQPHLQADTVEGVFIGPRAAMVTPWSTNATEITQNMAIEGIVRIEKYNSVGLTS